MDDDDEEVKDSETINKELEKATKEEDVDGEDTDEEEEDAEAEEEEVEEEPSIHTQVSIPRFSNTTNLDILDSVRGYSRTEALPTSSRDLHSVRLVHLPASGVIVNFV
tara:strand:- start:4935 stop:5258 length:324 start_codon:yes stop_codon:yes gene_type:complete